MHRDCMNIVRTKPVTVVPLEQSYLSLQEAFAQADCLNRKPTLTPMLSRRLPKCNRDAAGGANLKSLADGYKSIFGGYAMRFKAILYPVLISAAFLLTGCGGGGDDGPAPLLEVGALVNGQPTSLNVLPGTRQALFVRVGQSFELAASRPVTWSVFVGGTFIPGVGNTISSNGTNLQETLITDFRFVATTFGFLPGATPVQVTILATSQEDTRQVATVDVLLTD